MNRLKMLSLSDIQSAHARIKGFIHETPVVTSNTLNSRTGKHFFFKAEFLQKSGSFKARGAINSIIQAKEQGISSVSTHSSGNHAQAIAWASKTVGELTAHIVMPNNVPKAKKDAVLGYGAVTYSCEPTSKAREDTARDVTEKTNSLFIHPSENLNVICGQGTVGLELMHQIPNLDAIIVPVGGGGLISGIAICAKAIKPEIVIIGAEPLTANDAARSHEARELIKHTSTPVTIADGLRGNLGPVTWPLIRENVDDILTAPEDKILDALHLVWQRMKYLIEPSAAVGVAVALSDEFNSKYKSLKYVGVVLCGGNVDIIDVANMFQNAGLS